MTDAPFNYRGFVCVFNVEPRINYLIERKISIQLLSQFRMYLPMKQVIVYVPFAGNDKVTDEQLTEFLFDIHHIYDAEHIGRRSAKRGSVPSLEAFIQSHPEAEWENTVTRVSKIAKEKAVRQVKDTADFETAKREINRIVNGYESEYLYLGRDMSKIEKIKEKYDAVYYALSHPLLVLDSMALMYLNRR
jgi:hypothetical protein